MTGVDEVAKIVRRTVATRGCEVTCRLIAPGRIERMFRDGQQFDMRESQVLDVRYQPVRQFPVVEEIAIFVSLP